MDLGGMSFLSKSVLDGTDFSSVGVVIGAGTGFGATG